MLHPIHVPLVGLARGVICRALEDACSKLPTLEREDARRWLKGAQGLDQWLHRALIDGEVFADLIAALEARNWRIPAKDIRSALTIEDRPDTDDWRAFDDPVTRAAH